MLTPSELRRVPLSRRPVGQRLLADLYVRPTYALRGVDVVVEGMEQLLSPDPFIVAMNHTDRYNYFALQVELHHRHGRYLASWVKGKYYEHWFSRWFMRTMSNIPVPSRGYVIAGRFKEHLGRPPTTNEYLQLRSVLDGKTNLELSEAVQSHTGADPAAWAVRTEHDFELLSREAVELTRRALQVGMGVLIFPEGTRSPTLLKGHGGIAQIAQHFGIPIVPVGCSGSIDIYPGDTPWPHPGRITYRVGAPILPSPAMQAPAGFTPLSKEATQAHGAQFQAHVDLVMDRISELVDPCHRPSDAPTTTTTVGVDRFI